MRLRIRLFLASLSLSSLLGCAAVFRDGRAPVRIDSEPSGADVRNDGRYLGKTPGEVEMDRNSSTAVVISKEGYADHRGAVRKRLNAGWVTADVLTCVIPVALCIPLLVDAISGAWNDIDDSYRVKLDPAQPGSTEPAPPGSAPQGPPRPAPPPYAPDGGVPSGTIQI